MNEEEKKKFTDLLQKNLTKSCYTKCSSNPRTSIQCFDTCYEKYLQATNTVNEAIKEIGYEKNSVLAYKSYPEHNIESLRHISRTVLDTLPDAPFAVKYNERA